MQGFLQTALVVSSFHVLDMAAGDGMVERTVRILYGEGDRYGCWLDVLAANIVWHELSDPAVLPASQPGADMPADDVSGLPATEHFHEASTLEVAVQWPPTGTPGSENTRGGSHMQCTPSLTCPCQLKARPVCTVHIREACMLCLSCWCVQVSLGQQALQKATEHLKATIVSTSTLEGRIHTEAPLPTHDTSMGTLEHRLEGEFSEDSGPEHLPDGDDISQVADYNAWVHGPPGERPAEAPIGGSSSQLAKPSD